MLGTHDVRRVRRSEAEVHQPDGQVPQRQARRGRRQPCREEHHRQPGRLGARAARLRPDRGGLAAEEHDDGSGEGRDPKEAGQGDEGTREGQEGGAREIGNFIKSER
jgi:hypothetical protein